ncbi:MAG: methylated-DNA--[protein]-cysteine S-methyltransferase [Paludisphaera borealis]|uniref:methylated-DNA--[protein]-cysteine S-methyltransferase n=1 Tax=Paludisphaera borealis TaxID=1387353 RepID=UPI00284A44F2|nr:methylated-DNA--[protein]-cysteine S-methyltransferase [Paludisphaera borealis]MDR3619773.1 methylated-DNA--[protein]-cysteine S-methyltransferase [Paludisphaera borealis]
MSTSTHFVWYLSPIGEILMTARDGALTSLYLHGRRSDATISDDWTEGGSILDAARSQLEAYFDGRSQDFNLPMEPDGTPFQRRVWEELGKIPYSETISYAELARRVGKPSAARAVGGANGRNPISVIVPCHRVIAADGTLGGYGGGLDRKLWLLQHEAETLGRDTPKSWTAPTASARRVRG